MSNYDLVFENKDLFKDYYLYGKEEVLEFMPKFNSINIIVGANNSGKSRFMRNLMTLSNFYLLNDVEKIKKVLVFIMI